MSSIGTKCKAFARNLGRSCDRSAAFLEHCLYAKKEMYVLLAVVPYLASSKIRTDGSRIGPSGLGYIYNGRTGRRNVQGFRDPFSLPAKLLLPDENCRVLSASGFCVEVMNE